LWANQVDRYDGLNTTVSTKYPQQSLVEVKQRGYSTITFFCYLHYNVSSDKQIELVIKSVTRFNYGNLIRKTIESDVVTSDCYIWEETSFEGEEIFQKGFVLENLNLALIRFLEQCGER
jgi:acyl-ACP thioesterase